MKIVVSLISGSTLEVEVDENGTIADLSAVLAREKNVNTDQIRILFGGKFQKPENKLSEMNFNEGKKVIMMISKKPVNEKPSEMPKPQLTSPLKLTSPKNSPRPSPKANETPKQTKTRKMHSSPLPLFNTSKFNDPPDFNDKVKNLEAMGFDYRDCCQALRAAMYSLETAADYLLSGHIPDIPEIPRQAAKVNETKEDETKEDKITFAGDEYDEEEEEEPLVTPEIVQALYDHPEQIDAFLNKLIEVNPYNAILIKNNPALVLAQIGIDPTKFDLSAYQNQSMFTELMSKFTKEEQETIKRLAAKGYDTMTVIQVFEACGKDEELTLQCLGPN